MVNDDRRKRRIELHGVPMDLGANQRGVDMGPSALRIAGLAESLRALGHEVVDRDELEIRSRVALPEGDADAKYLAAIAAACSRIADIARDIMGRGVTPIFMGGDHSLATGTISGVARHFRDRNEKVGVIWFDAHADFNTPGTSPSGNVHGMPLASLLGYGPDALCEIGGWRGKVEAKNTVVVGARDIDEGERENVARAGITVFSMKEIDELGMKNVTRKAIEIASDGTAGIHLSFDIDGLDPDMAPGVGTPVRGGVNYREAHLFMELLAESGRVCSLDVVELNPIRDDRNRTAETVVLLVESLFGKRVI